MGVTDAAKILKLRFGQAFASRLPDEHVSSILFDGNSLLHAAAQKTWGYGAYESPERARVVKKQSYETTFGQFLIAVQTEIADQVRKIRPKNDTVDLLVFAIDGVAPNAKLVQQRQRRIQAYPVNGFDRNAITPGTALMNKVTEHLVAWFKSPDTLNALGVRKIIFSPVENYGEGEHKIMDLFRRNKIKGSGNHVIVGMDADLILLSLLLTTPQILLYRENTFKGKEGRPRVVRDVLYVDQLRMALLQDLGKPSAIHDFLFMFMPIGNDFVPRYPILADAQQYLENAMAVYQQMEEGIVDPVSGEVNWIMAQDFYRRMSGLPEREMVQNFIQAPDLVEPLKPLEKSVTRFTGGQFRLNSEKFEREYYQHVFLPLRLEDLEFILGEGYSQVTPAQVEELTVSYLQSVQWMILYYVQGMDGTDLRHYFKFHYCPLFKTQIQVIDTLKDTGRLRDLDVGVNDTRMTPWEQLLTVLPIQSRELLPKPMQKMMDFSSPIRDLYPDEVVIDHQGKTKEHLGIVRIANVDPERVTAALAGLPDRYQSYTFEPDIEIVDLSQPRARPHRMFTPATQEQTAGRGRGDRQGGRGKDDRGEGDRQGGRQGGRGKDDRGENDRRGGRGDRQGGRGDRQGGRGDRQPEERRREDVPRPPRGRLVGGRGRGGRGRGRGSQPIRPTQTYVVSSGQLM